jgi:hypothetical protein
MYYDTGTLLIMVFNGTGWDPAGTGSAGPGYDATTSTTSITIATGSQAFTVGAVGAYVVGSRVRVINTGTPANYVEGVIASIAALVVTVTVDTIGGSGTFTAWTFSIAGNPGSAGATGATGAAGAAGSAGATGATGATGPAGGLTARTTAVHTTASIANNATESSTITMGISYRLLKITTSVGARVRLYATAAQQAADLSRAIGTDPTGNHGLMFEFVTTGALLTAVLSPMIDGVNTETTPVTTIPLTVTNLSGSTGTVAVTLGYQQTE